MQLSACEAALQGRPTDIAKLDSNTSFSWFKIDAVGSCMTVLVATEYSASFCTSVIVLKAGEPEYCATFSISVAVLEA
jgi:hypothetical protein